MTAVFVINGRKYYINYARPTVVLRRPIVYGQPSPTPWLESDVVSHETVMDLAELARIEQQVGRLRNPKLKKQLAVALNDSLASVELPPEMSVHFDDLRIG